MKAIHWHNLVVPCLSEIIVDQEEPSGKKGLFVLNPECVIRYQSDGVLITLPRLMFESIYLDKDLASVIKNRMIDISELSFSSVKLLKQSGLLLSKPIKGLDYFEQSYTVANLPNRAILDLTHECNCHCLTCYHRDDLDNYQPSLADLINRINKLKSFGVVNFEITGGEPLLRHDLIEILNYLINQRLNYFLVTNGEYLEEVNDDLIELLKKAIAVVISLDGVGDRHDLARKRPGLYDKILRGLRNLSQKNVRFAFIYTVQEANVHDIPEAIELAYSMNAIIQLRPVKIVGSA